MKYFILSLLLVAVLIPFVMASFIYHVDGAETLSELSQSDSTLGLKIITPINDKSVPVGSLTIMGTSTDNENSNCTVFVDWNNQKPFQKAIATGPYGEGDYSSWTYTYSPSYHNIINGTNNLTSKLECQKNSVITSKWNSINVTGIQSESIRKSNPTSVYNGGNSKVLPQLASHLKVSTNNSSQISASEIHPVPPPKILSTLFSDLKVGKNIASPGEAQSIVLKVMDAKSLRLMSGANVQLHITDGKKESVFPGVTNSQGLYNHSWTLDPTKFGMYKVVANVSLPGYVPRTYSANFQVQGQLLVQVNLAKGVVNPGDAQSIVAKVMDAKSLRLISGANVQLHITDGMKGSEFPGVTNSQGLYNHSWTLDPTSKPGAYKVVANVSLPGYVPRTYSANFQVHGQLLVQVNLAKGVVNPGDAQTLTVNVMDATTKQKISGASVAGKISSSKKFSSITDGNGITSYSWNISPVSGGTMSKVTLNVVHEGYSELSKIVTFKTGKSMNLLGPPEEIQTKQIKIQPVKIIEGNACMGHKQNSDCADNSKLRQKAKGVDSFLESLTDQITG